MEKINVTEMIRDLIENLLAIENKKEFEYNSIKKIIFDFFNVLIDGENIIYKDKDIYVLIEIIENFYPNDFIIKKLIEEYKNKAFRNYLNNFYSNSLDTNKEKENSGKNNEFCHEKNAIIKYIDGKYILINKNEIKLPEKGNYSSILNKKKIDGKDYLLGEYIVDYQGNIIEYKDYDEKIISDEELDSIYSNIDDNLVYHDDDYLDFISKNEEDKYNDKNHEAPKPEFTSDINFDDHDCDCCDEDCHDTFDDDRRKVIKRKKSRKAKEADL